MANKAASATLLVYVTSPVVVGRERVRVQTFMSKSRKWTFTVNNYTEDDQQRVRFLASEARYLVYGREVGDSGTPHLQGFVYLGNARSLSSLKRSLPGAHLEVARGSFEQNRTYCSKDGDFEEFGELPKDAKAKGEEERARWKRALDFAKAGEFEEIDADIYLRYYRTIKQVFTDHQPRVEDLPDVTGVWFHGPPGGGKSHRARADYPQAYVKNQNKWWCGYANEQHVIIDDLDSAAMGHLLKIWADRYAFTAEIKGGSLRIRPRVIVVTSNYKIEELFAADPVLAAAIKRRFKSTYFPPRTQ